MHPKAWLTHRQPGRRRIRVLDPPRAEAATRLEPTFPVPSVSQFYNDLNTLLAFAADGPAKSFCFRRLTLLESKFQYVDPSLGALRLCQSSAADCGEALRHLAAAPSRLHIQLNDVEEKASCKVGARAPRNALPRRAPVGADLFRGHSV